MNTRVFITRTVLVGALQSGLFWFDRFVEVLYAVAILRHGTVRGIFEMMIFSFFVCWFLLVVYDRVCTLNPERFKRIWLKTLVEAASDVLGFEAVKNAGSKALESIMQPTEWSGSWFNKAKFLLWEPLRRYMLAPLMKSLISRGLERLAKYLSLSLLTDAMTTVILMRPAHYHKMGLREWSWFIPSVFLSCIGWGALMSGIIQIGKYVL